MTEEQKVRDYWGDRCPDVEPTCATCAAWALFDELKRLPTDDEVAAKTDAAREQAEAIERVARVLCKRCGVDPDDMNGGAWDGGSYPAGKPAWQSWEDDARAAVDAMPAPTKGHSS